MGLNGILVRDWVLPMPIRAIWRVNELRDIMLNVKGLCVSSNSIEYSVVDVQVVFAICVVDRVNGAVDDVHTS